MTNRATRTDIDSRTFWLRMRIGYLAVATLAIVASIVAAYRFWLRPWHLRWGATVAEFGAQLPGDEIVVAANFASTRALTIAAAPERVWAWLVQIGQGSGGFYSYDLLENLSGLKIHSTHRIEARLQQLTPGDVIAVEPGGSGYTVVAVEPGRLLLLQLDGQGPGEMGAQFRVADAASTWAFTLHPQTGGRTRLIARWRARYPGPKSHSRLAFFIGIFLEPIEFFMERKMLLGIRQRAEKDHDALRSQEPM